jgi:hypothetical protein
VGDWECGQGSTRSTGDPNYPLQAGTPAPISRRYDSYDNPWNGRFICTIVKLRKAEKVTRGDFPVFLVKTALATKRSPGGGFSQHKVRVRREVVHIRSSRLELIKTSYDGAYSVVASSPLSPPRSPVSGVSLSALQLPNPRPVRPILLQSRWRVLRSTDARQLAAFPVRVFAVGIEYPLQVPIEISQICPPEEVV